VRASPHHYGLPSAEYGVLFVPQMLMAIVTSLFRRELARR
jgi:hypothetical protein